MKKRDIVSFIILEIIHLACISVFAFNAAVIFMDYSDMQFAWIQAIGYTAGAVLLSVFAVVNAILFRRRARSGNSDTDEPQEQEHVY